MLLYCYRYHCHCCPIVKQARRQIEFVETRGSFWVLSLIAVGNSQLVWVGVTFHNLWFRRDHERNCDDFPRRCSAQIHRFQYDEGVVALWALFTLQLFNLKNVGFIRVEKVNIGHYRQIEIWWCLLIFTERLAWRTEEVRELSANNDRTANPLVSRVEE